VNNYFQLIKNALPSIEEGGLNVPVRETGIDSIDLVVIRVILEKFIGKEIPNVEWNNFKTIQQAIAYCRKHESGDLKFTEIENPVVTAREHEINMPQMANSALSENWLFKEIGDIHWELLSKGLNAKSAGIKDETGNRLYATFTRIRISGSPLYNFIENDYLMFQGQLMRFGLSTYISEVSFQNKNQSSKASLMTSFSTRDSIDNSKLFKSQPVSAKNQIPEYPSTPDILNDYRLLRKNLLESFSLSGEEFDLFAVPITEIKYNINPFYEINGVGLLYFASYPIISDKCESDYFNSTGNYGQWESKFYTTDRDIFYFANCNIDDSILYRLNNFEFIRENKVKLFSSLYRSSDMTLMAHIFTIKTRRA
jgi:probable biosynthetic protein (TIGR04098 family)